MGNRFSLGSKRDCKWERSTTSMDIKLLKAVNNTIILVGEPKLIKF